MTTLLDCLLEDGLNYWKLRMLSIKRSIKIVLKAIIFGNKLVLYN